MAERIAYLCNRLGPYHLAQLNVANTYTAITAIEFSAKDQTYAWDYIEDAVGSIQRLTLFKDAPIATQTSKTVVERLRGVLDELRPQVVAISGWEAPASLIALRWCLETNTPTIMMSDSQRQDAPRVWWKEYVKGRLVRLASAGFVGGAPHIAYLRDLGMAQERVFTGGDVVDNDYFADGALIARRNAASVRQQCSLPEDYFLVSCRFVPKKNLQTVLRAYAKYLLVAGSEAWKLVLLGDGPLKYQLTTLRRELGLEEMVLMPGFKQYAELPAYYGLAGALVLASTTEQWGLVVNEAMASGLPVIVSSRCGCASDLVHHGQNGFRFDPYDVEDLARHLAYLSSNQCPRYLMGNESRRIIAGWDLDLFGRNLSKAAELAKRIPPKGVGVLDKAILWTLIRFAWR